MGRPISRFSLAGYNISVSYEQREEGTYSVVYCPFCGFKVESVSRISEEHAGILAKGKLYTHIKMKHQIDTGNE
jgi:hypothetical protein